MLTDYIKNTFYPDATELCIFYYSGHGLKSTGLLELHSIQVSAADIINHWFQALMDPKSNNCRGEIKRINKHLVLILDSCFSGVLIDECKLYADKLPEGCSITIQASSGDCGSYAGLFTPTFFLIQDELFFEDAQRCFNGLDETVSGFLNPCCGLRTSESLKIQNYHLTLAMLKKGCLN